MRQFSKKLMVGRLTAIAIGIPVLVLFLSWFSGPDLKSAFGEAVSFLGNARTAPFIWGIIALTTLGLFFLTRPVLAFYFCELENRSATVEDRDSAMRTLNILPALVIAISIGGNVLGLLAEFVFSPAPPPASVGEVFYKLGMQVSTGLMMAMLIIFNFERVLLPAKKLLGEKPGSVKQAYVSFFLKITLVVAALIGFFAFQIFDSASYIFMGAVSRITPDGGLFTPGMPIFQFENFENVKHALEVQGVKVFLLCVLGVHVLMLIKHQIRGPLGIIRSRLSDMNSGAAVVAQKIDIVHNDEFTPVFHEINKLIGRQQEELSTSKGRLEDLVTYAADAIVSFDKNASIVIANPAARQMFGYTEDELAQMKMSQLIVLPAELAGLCEHNPWMVIDHFEQQATRPFRMTGVAKSGRKFELETNFSKVQGVGGEWIFTAIIRDISAHVEFEKQLLAAKLAAEDSSKLKSEFLANMSHELRTPLNAILGFTQLMSDDKNLTEGQRSKLQTINSSGEHLLDLINDILDISKIEAGKYEVHEEVFDIAEFIRTLGDMFRLKCEEKGLQLYIETVGTLPRYVRGDLGKIRQILINLLGNAVKFTSEGGVSMTVGLEEFGDGATAAAGPVVAAGEAAGRVGGSSGAGAGATGATDSRDAVSPNYARDISSAAAGRVGGSSGAGSSGAGASGNRDVAATAEAAPANLSRIRFSITDTGVGISESDKTAITSPFTQAKNARNEGGTGLGLAISSRFISMLGGKLEIESELGRGSTFAFSLPLPAEESGPERTERRGRLVGLAPGVPAPRVLVVDDKESNRLILSEMLERAGVITTEASDGRKAIDRAREFNPDIIFMDIKMPGMDGYDAVAEMAKDPALSKIPVFALTASAFKHDEQKILASGFTGFLAKPFKLARLFGLIEEHTSFKFQYIEEEGEGSGPAPDTWRRLEPARLAQGFSGALVSDLEAALAINDFDSISRLLELSLEGGGAIPQGSAFEALKSAASSYDDKTIGEVLAAIRAGLQIGAGA